MKKYAHLFFDLDRTLWDYERNAQEAFVDILEMLGLTSEIPDPEAFKNRYDHHNEILWEQYRKGEVSKAFLSVERFSRTLSEFNINDKALSEELGKVYMETIPQKPHLVPNTKKTLKYLKNKGYSLNIITNGFQEIQSVKMKSSRILHFFDRVLTSDEAGFQKPGKEIFNHSLTACKASKNKSVMIGDDFEADIAGAANFGMDQVFYVNGKEPLKMAFQPTYVIKDISELMEIL